MSKKYGYISPIVSPMSLLILFLNSVFFTLKHSLKETGMGQSVSSGVLYMLFIFCSFERMILRVEYLRN
jgi:hypothetical protein